MNQWKFVYIQKRTAALHHNKDILHFMGIEDTAIFCFWTRGPRDNLENQIEAQFECCTRMHLQSKKHFTFSLVMNTGGKCFPCLWKEDDSPSPRFASWLCFSSGLRWICSLFSDSSGCSPDSEGGHAAVCLFGCRTATLLSPQRKGRLR